MASGGRARAARRRDRDALVARAGVGARRGRVPARRVEVDPRCDRPQPAVGARARSLLAHDREPSLARARAAVRPHLLRLRDRLARERRATGARRGARAGRSADPSSAPWPRVHGDAARHGVHASALRRDPGDAARRLRAADGEDPALGADEHRDRGGDRRHPAGRCADHVTAAQTRRRRAQPAPTPPGDGARRARRAALARGCGARNLLPVHRLVAPVARGVGHDARVRHRRAARRPRGSSSC